MDGAVTVDVRSDDAPQRNGEKAVSVTRITFEGPGLAADDLKLPLKTFVAEALKRSTFFRDKTGEVVSRADATEEQEREYYAKLMPSRKNWKGARLTDEQLREVADAYRALFEQGSRKPTQNIADATDTPRPTVARWVGEARKRGLLPAAERGKASAGQIPF